MQETSRFGAKTNNTPPDEQVIQSLQHSLFCAKLFDSIRQEISQGHGTNPTNATTIKPRQIVWLSSEMEESFLPPPSVMVGGGDNEGLYSPLCVVHCHEGELKVQLDAEYALTVKLVDDEQVKTATRSDGSNSTNNHKEEEEKVASVDSGSRTPEQLHALCRMLLLHAQFVYHDHCTKQQEEEEAASRERKTENGSGTSGRRQALSGRYGQRSNGGGGPGGQTSLNGGGRKRVRLSPHIFNHDRQRTTHHQSSKILAWFSGSIPEHDSFQHISTYNWIIPTIQKHEESNGRRSQPQQR